MHTKYIGTLYVIPACKPFFTSPLPPHSLPTSAHAHPPNPPGVWELGGCWPGTAAAAAVGGGQRSVAVVGGL